MHAISKFLQFCSNTRMMTCFWWQLTHNITIHTIRLSLKESCLKINVQNVPTLAGCHLATHPKSRSCGSRGICLLIFLLFVSETSQYPSCLCLEKVSLFVRLDGEHPSAGYIISRFDLPQINKIENFIVNPRFVFQHPLTSLAKASFRARDLLVAFILAAFSAGRHTSFQHISSSTVNSFWNFKLFFY